MRRLAVAVLCVIACSPSPASAKARPWLSWDRAAVHITRNVRAVERVYGLTVDDDACLRETRTVVGCFVTYRKETPDAITLKTDYVEARLRGGRVVVVDSYRTNEPSNRR